MRGPGTSQDLNDIERKMLEAVAKEWERYQQQDGPIPQTLVKLMVDVHDRLMKRLARSHGQNQADLGTREGLAALLLQLEQERQEVIELLQQRDFYS